MSATATENVKAQVVEKLETVFEAVDDGVEATEKKWKRGVHAARELSDQALERMRKKPVRSAAICAFVGMGLGLLTGWLLGRSGRSRLF